MPARSTPCLPPRVPLCCPFHAGRSQHCPFSSTSSHVASPPLFKLHHLAFRLLEQLPGFSVSRLIWLPSRLCIPTGPDHSMPTFKTTTHTRLLRFQNKVQPSRPVIRGLPHPPPGYLTLHKPCTWGKTQQVSAPQTHLTLCLLPSFDLGAPSWDPTSISLSSCFSVSTLHRPFQAHLDFFSSRRPLLT